MSRYLRPRAPGACIFFTVALAERGTDLLVRKAGHLRVAMAKTKTGKPFAIDAMVVMPDHIHAVWTLPEGDSDFSTRWGAIKARFTRSLRRVGFHPTDPRSGVGWNPTLRSASKVAKGDAGLWQRRFWEHHIRDEADYIAHVSYCHMDPVKHGYVQRPADWPYSSIHREIRLGRIKPDWSGSVADGAYGE